MLRKFATVLLLLFTLAGGSLIPQGVTESDDWEEINFEYNSSKLVDGFPSLLRLAELLQKNTGYKVTLEGHADTIGSTGYNQKLGWTAQEPCATSWSSTERAPNQITTTSARQGQSQVSRPEDQFHPHR